jgi:hypothetical protein
MPMRAPETRNPKPETRNPLSTPSLRLLIFPSLPRSGFSFAEVMFAVVLLGIGFIMVAGIFPVAIKQSQLNTEETVAIAISRNGVNVMTELATQTNPNYGPTQTAAALPGESLLSTTDVPGSPINPDDMDPGTSLRLGKMISMKDRRLPNAAATYLQRDGMWKAVCGNMIQPGDPRFAWVPLYRRDVLYRNVGGVGQTEPYPFAQIVLIGCTIRNRSVYESFDYISGTGAAATQIPDDQFYTLEPKPVAVRIKPDADGTYFIQFFSIRGLPGSGGFPSGGSAAMYEAFASEAVAEGTFVVISDDRIIDKSAGTVGRNTGRMNGKIYRVGVRRPELDEPGKYAWSLQLGFDFTPDPGDDGVFYAAPTAGKLKDDINAVGVDGLATTTVNGVPTDGSNIGVVGNATQKGAVAYIIGRGFTIPNPATPLPPGAGSSTASYEGATQDVAVYTTFVPVR